MKGSKAAAPKITRLDKRFRWPGGRRIAVIFNIAYEGWSDGKAPGIGPMGNPLTPGYFDTNADSWARFGPTRGIQRLIGIAERHRVKTSVMVNGVLAQRYPDTVAMLSRLGHEIVSHSWGMDVIPVYLDEAKEKENLQRTTQILAKVSGTRPCGWISPRGTGSPITPRVLADAGYAWHGDCNDDDLPYLMDFGGKKKIVAISLGMDVNDLPHCIRYGNAPRGLLDIYNDTMAAMTKREEGPMLLDVTAHTHVFGRAAGAWVYDEIMASVKRRRDVWIATREQIAQHVLATLGN